MSLLTYESARPWAKAMKAAVLSRKMPPWFADPAYGHFSNERRLSDKDIQTIAAWADAGAPEGNRTERPAPVSFPEGWNIKPDIIIEMPNEVQIPAAGTIEYQVVVVKTNFPEDMWVVEAENRPGNREVVHHMRTYVRPPGSRYAELASPGIAMDEPRATPKAQPGERINTTTEMLARWNPGLTAQDFSMGGAAKFVPKGSDIVFQMHYTASGKPALDRSKVGFVLAKTPPKRRYYTSGSFNDGTFTIEPGDPNSESVYEITVLQDDLQLVWLQPHMHLRGKDVEIRATYPTGETETILKSKFDFNWQLGYEFEKPVPLPKGTRLSQISHWDNSPNNPFNPNPKATVRFGLQNWDEMSGTFIGITGAVKSDPSKAFRTPRGGTQALD